jgi:hypothetical protein
MVQMEDAPPRVSCYAAPVARYGCGVPTVCSVLEQQVPIRVPPRT